MPDWLMTILNIILFIVCLSTLVLVHEAGHLATAKMFGVYCDDFSIGFGKAFLHKKRKNGETYFSLRVVPFGGYVSMASNEGELENGVVIPKERSLNGIKKWKAAIIMSAGIIMNLILSILLFYIYNQFFPTINVPYINALLVQENSVAETAGFKTFNPKTGEGDFIDVTIDPRYPNVGEQIWYYSFDSIVHYENGESENNIAVVVHQNQTSSTNTNFDNLFRYYKTHEVTINEETSQKMVVANFEEEITYETEGINSIELVLPTFYVKQNTYYCTSCGARFIDIDNINNCSFITLIDNNYYHKNCPNQNDENHGIVTSNIPGGDKTIKINLNEDKTGFTSTGLSMFKEQYMQDFGQAWTNTFVQFADGSTLIFKTIGGLFIGQGWENVGSIISIYTSTSSILNEMGVSYFIYYWGLISVNLAIFNLLPFPGLDGWQLIVIAIEGIFRKKVPEKAKTIMSYIGMALLFGLMIVLIIKDIVGLF